MVLVGLFFCVEKLKESMRGMELWGKSNRGLGINISCRNMCSVRQRLVDNIYSSQDSKESSNEVILMNIHTILKNA